MTELFGWLGCLLLAATFLSLVVRRMHRRQGDLLYYHHFLALSSLAVLTLHGLLALSRSYGWGHGWGHGLRAHFYNGMVVSGIFTWAVLGAVCAWAVMARRGKGSVRSHSWLTSLLVLLVIFHLLSIN